MNERIYKRYLLAILALILAANTVGDISFGLVLQDIKVELKLSDTQLGFMSGISFAFFYATMGLPLARWADRSNRVMIIALTAALWSAAVVLCSLATTFLQLLLIRVGMAVGEAGSIPPPHSLIADHFSRTDRPRAIARHMLGASVGVVIGYLLGGWLNQLYGWRMTFVVVGLPSLGLAALAMLTLNDPRRHRPAAAAEPTASTAVECQPQMPSGNDPSLKILCKTLWANATFRHVLFFYCVVHFFGYGIQKWQPAFFIRSFGMETGTLGLWLAVTFGLTGMLGVYWGAELACRRGAGDEPLQLKAMAAAYSSFAGISILVYLSRNHYVAFALQGLANLGGTLAIGPLFALVQTLVPERMRASAVAIMFLFANLIGMGLGPFLAGVLSDLLYPLVGEESLRYALLALCPGYFWGAWHLWQASKTVTRDLRHAGPDTVKTPHENELNSFYNALESPNAARHEIYRA